jgi:hypothetical protein
MSFSWKFSFNVSRNDHITVSINKGKWQMTLIETHQKAVDAEVTFSDGTNHLLSDLWKKRPLLLVFLRHFG